MPRIAVPIAVSQDQIKQIEEWLAALGTPQQVALRCRIIRESGRGQPEAAVAAVLGIHRNTVRLWKGRFAQKGLQALWEIAPGRGRKATYTAEQVKQVIDATPAVQAEREHTLELPADGGKPAHEQVHDQQSMAQP